MTMTMIIKYDIIVVVIIQTVYDKLCMTMVFQIMVVMIILIIQNRMTMVDFWSQVLNPWVTIGGVASSVCSR